MHTRFKTSLRSAVQRTKQNNDKQSWQPAWGYKMVREFQNTHTRKRLLKHTPLFWHLHCVYMDCVVVKDWVEKTSIVCGICMDPAVRSLPRTDKHTCGQLIPCICTLVGLPQCKRADVLQRRWEGLTWEQSFFWFCTYVTYASWGVVMSIPVTLLRRITLSWWEKQRSRGKENRRKRASGCVSSSIVYQWFGRMKRMRERA